MEETNQHDGKHKLRFLVRLLFFLFALLVLLFLINFFYYNLVIEKTVTYRKEVDLAHYLERNTDRSITYAFFGDSHFRDDINPGFINSSYNFATTAESFIETYYKLRRLVEKERISLNTLVIQLDLHSFSGAKSDDSHLLTELWLFKEYIPYTTIAHLRNESVIAVFLKSWFPFIGNGKEFFLPKPLTPLYLGWTNETGDFSQQDKEEVAEIKYQKFFGGKEHIDRNSLVYFIKLLEYSAEHNLSLIFVKTPITQEYHNVLVAHNISGDPYYDQFYTKIFTLINATIDTYTVLDYYDDYSGQPHLYRDSNHFNFRGAEIFSKRLNKDLSSHSLADT